MHHQTNLLLPPQSHCLVTGKTAIYIPHRSPSPGHPPAARSTRRSLSLLITCFEITWVCRSSTLPRALRPTHPSSPRLRSPPPAPPRRMNALGCTHAAGRAVPTHSQPATTSLRISRTHTSVQASPTTTAIGKAAIAMMGKASPANKKYVDTYRSAYLASTLHF